MLYSELVWLPLLLLTRLSVCPGVRVQVVPESLSIYYHMYIYKSVLHACSIHYDFEAVPGREDFGSDEEGAAAWEKCLVFIPIRLRKGRKVHRARG